MPNHANPRQSVPKPTQCFENRYSSINLVKGRNRYLQALIISKSAIMAHVLFGLLGISGLINLYCGGSCRLKHIPLICAVKNMELQKNFQLRNYNTFRVSAYASYFARFNSAYTLEELLGSHHVDSDKIVPMVLGGGSNILFMGNCELVLKNEIMSIHLVGEDDEHVYVKAGAGESWHSLVMYCVQKNYGGIENLSLIPGSVGASPLQNIGAYGVELKDVLYELNAFHFKEKKVVVFTNSDCEFRYRNSVFKQKYKDQFAILDVTFRLKKEPLYNTSYVALKTELERMGVQDLNLAVISQAIINVRSAKLPDPAKIGNAGSFFKNPEIPRDVYLKLVNSFPGLVAFELDDASYKLAAGWLIEQCGFKGFRRGDAGCYEKQALVLVNYGEATGAEIYALSEEIIKAVSDKFQLVLEREVNVIK